MRVEEKAELGPVRLIGWKPWILRKINLWLEERQRKKRERKKLFFLDVCLEKTAEMKTDWHQRVKAEKKKQEIWGWSGLENKIIAQNQCLAGAQKCAGISRKFSEESCFVVYLPYCWMNLSFLNFDWPRPLWPQDFLRPWGSSKVNESNGRRHLSPGLKFWDLAFWLLEKADCLNEGGCFSRRYTFARGWNQW